MGWTRTAPALAKRDEERGWGECGWREGEGERATKREKGRGKGREGEWRAGERASWKEGEWERRREGEREGERGEEGTGRLQVGEGQDLL